MVFGEVVTMVAFPLEPVDFELFLGYSVLDPEESHVHGFGSSNLGPFVGKTICCGVVSGYSGRL